MAAKTINLKTKLLLIVIGCITLFGCNNGENTVKNKEVKDSNPNSKDTLVTLRAKTKRVFYTLPSPLETASIIKKTGIQYNEDLLNPLSSLANYTTNKKLALNLGVYGADLSYASLFDQKQTTIKYMAAVKQLAEQLGILNAFKQSDVKKLEDNINNKEIITKIIAETFFNSDAYLKENNRPEIAVFIVVGGWIESFYLASQLSKRSDNLNKELLERIIDLRMSLATVISLLESYQQNPDVASLQTEMFELQKIYDKLIKTETVAVKDKKTNQTVLKTKVKQNLTPEVLNVLYEKAKKIRTNYVQ